MAMALPAEVHESAMEREKELWLLYYSISPSPVDIRQTIPYNHVMLLGWFITGSA